MRTSEVGESPEPREHFFWAVGHSATFRTTSLARDLGDGWHRGVLSSIFSKD